jgi:hypothetical protein
LVQPIQDDPNPEKTRAPDQHAKEGRRFLDMNKVSFFHESTLQKSEAQLQKLAFPDDFVEQKIWSGGLKVPYSDEIVT